jgi:hypothetical protein
MSDSPTTLALVRKIQDLWRASKSDSLIDYTQESRVEPIVLIGTDVLYNEMLPDLMQTNLSLVAAYYLQAVAISATVGNIEVARTLSKLNPKRSAADAAADSLGWIVAHENYEHRLPTLAAKMALEAIGDRDREVETFTVHRDTNRELKELSNLAVGKMLMVDISDGCHKATIPVSVRLQASSLPIERLAHILASGSQDISIKERWKQMRSGEIEMLRDFVLCEDLVEEHRKNLKADKSGIYAQILSNRRENSIAAIVSANPSVATASNIAVISRETADQIERLANGKLSNPKVRERIFAKTSLMLLNVVDAADSRVTIYSRGIAMATEVGARDLRSVNAGTGPNVSDVLKAYQLGTSPSL